MNHQYWTLTETPLRHPAVALSHGDPAAMILQDQSLNVPQQVIEKLDVGVGQLKPWLCALMVAELVSLGPWNHPLRQRVEPAFQHPL